MYVTPSESHEMIFKVILVGEPNVGKTSFMMRYCKDEYSTIYKSTIGALTLEKRIRWRDDLIVTLRIWDLAGQERLGDQVGFYFRDADAAICVCDVLDPSSRHA